MGNARADGALTVDDHDIALSHALLAKDPGQDLDFVQELAIRVFLGGMSDGRLPDDGDVVPAAIGDMAIDAVVAGGDLAVREPRPMCVLDAAGQGLGLVGQGSRGAAVPVEPVCVSCPEGLGVLERMLESCVLGVWRHCP